MIDREYDFEPDEMLEALDEPAFAAWLAREAQSLHTPPATPNAEMWAAISAAQRESAEAPRVLPFRHRGWAWPALVAAALLVGIGLDRLMTTPGTGAPVSAPSTRVASAPTPSATAPSVTTPAIGTARPDAEPAATRTTGSRPASTRVADAGTRRSDAASTTPSEERRAASANLYHLAAVQTLGQAEALLTAYRASGVAEHDPAAARQLGRWGRDVLSSTRLLLDSPAGDDPSLRPLLNDLELVLVQIIGLSGTPLDESERALIDRSLRERDLLPRLHTAVPAGSAGAASDE